MLETIQRLLKSRKFLVSLAVILASLAVKAVPSLAPYQNDLGNLMFALAGLFIAGTTVEDSVQKWAARPATDTEAVREIITELMDEYFAVEEEEGDGQ